MSSESYSALRTARTHLNAAHFCVDGNRQGLAASEAYYTMYHAVRAWALREEGEAPRSHKGMGMILYQKLLNEGLSQRHKRQFDLAFQSRRRWHYAGLGPDPEAEVPVLIAGAKEMIEHVS